MPGMDHLLTKAFLATGGAVAYKQFQCVKQVAESTLQPAQCAIMTAGDTNPPLGVVQEPLDAVKTATGKAFVGVALSGNTKVIVGATAVVVEMRRNHVLRHRLHSVDDVAVDVGMAEVEADADAEPVEILLHEVHQ